MSKHPPPDRGLSQPKKQESQSHLLAMRAEYAGPLPPPEMLKKYEECLPGTADRILQRFVSEGDHRRDLERRALEAEIEDAKAERSDARRGQLFGFIVAVLGLIVSALVACLNSSPHAVWAGSVLGGTTLIGLVTVFIVGRKSKLTEKGQGAGDEKR